MVEKPIKIAFWNFFLFGWASKELILNGISGPSDLENRDLAAARALILVFGLFQHKHRLEKVFV